MSGSQNAYHKAKLHTHPLLPYVREMLEIGQSTPRWGLTLLGGVAFISQSSKCFGGENICYIYVVYSLALYQLYMFLNSVCNAFF